MASEAYKTVGNPINSDMAAAQYHSLSAQMSETQAAQATEEGNEEEANNLRLQAAESYKQSGMAHQSVAQGLHALNTKNLDPSNLARSYSVMSPNSQLIVQTSQSAVDAHQKSALLFSAAGRHQDARGAYQSASRSMFQATSQHASMGQLAAKAGKTQDAKVSEANAARARAVETQLNAQSKAEGEADGATKGVQEEGAGDPKEYAKRLRKAAVSHSAVGTPEAEQAAAVLNKKADQLETDDATASEQSEPTTASVEAQTAGEAEAAPAS